MSDDYLAKSAREAFAADNTRKESEEIARLTRLRAELAAERETYTDPDGRTWHRPSARGYSQVMKVLDECGEEIEQLAADLAAVTAERDAAKRSAYEDAARFIEENVFNYSSTEINYWSKRKGGDSNGLEYARVFREKAAAIRSRK